MLGCAVNGIGEARHADFGITGAKDMGMIYSRGEPLKKVPTEHLVDELFAEIDRYYEAGKRVVRDEASAAEARAWLAENEDATAMTPERLAAMEAAAAEAETSRRRAARRGRIAGRRAALHPGVAVRAAGERASAFRRRPGKSGWKPCARGASGFAANMATNPARSPGDGPQPDPFLSRSS